MEGAPASVIPFYLTFVAVMLSGLGSRDQVTLASYSGTHGKSVAALIMSVIVSIGTAAFAGWAATMVIPMLGPAARVFLCAMAVAFAGAESLVIAPRASKREPKRSLGQLFVAMLFHQLTDAARFIVFGIAVAAQAPVTAAAGGALGGAALVGLAWAFPSLVLHGGARLTRRLLGIGFVLIGAYLAMLALGWV
ncbi:MAG: hypothetical protein KDE25_14890 [Novosphingobium sp.]|nr:hypothetical protein [Novosphingobium sp.]